MNYEQFKADLANSKMIVSGLRNSTEWRFIFTWRSNEIKGQRDVQSVELVDKDGHVLAIVPYEAIPLLLFLTTPDGKMQENVERRKANSDMLDMLANGSPRSNPKRHNRDWRTLVELAKEWQMKTHTLRKYVASDGFQSQRRPSLMGRRYLRTWFVDYEVAVEWHKEYLAAQDKERVE